MSQTFFTIINALAILLILFLAIILPVYRIRQNSHDRIRENETKEPLSQDEKSKSGTNTPE